MAHRSWFKREIFFISLCSMLYAPFSNASEVSYAISVYGDIKYPPGFTHFDYANAQAPKGGAIVLPEIGSFDSLNPYILKGRPAANMGLLFDTLMSDAQDETSTSYGLIASSVEYDEANTYIIFNLRPEAKFSDGSALTADDVVFSFDTLKNKGHPQFKILYAEVKSATRMDDHKVRFDFSNPQDRQLKLLVGEMPVISKKYYSSHEFNKTTTEPPLGSGPYLVENVDQGRSIIYKRNPDYWAKDLAVNIGRYNFGRIRYEYYLDVNVAIQAFKSGAVDLRYENIAKNWANSYNIPAVKDGRIIKEKIRHGIPQGIQTFVINNRRDKFSDRRVRQALSQALDFEWMNKNLFYNSYTRNNSYFANSIYASGGIPQGKELEILEPFRDQLPPELFTEEFKLPVSDSSGRIRERLIYAKRLLEEAGWHIADGALTNDKGEKFIVEILVIQGSAFDRILGNFRQNLAVLGITSTIKSVDTSQFKQQADNFDYDIFINSWPGSLAPGQEQMGYWHSSSADTKGGENYAGIKNPVVDKLVEAVVKAGDKETLLAATHALDRVLLWNYYTIPQWYIDSFRLLYWNKFARPEVLPKYDNGFGLMTWWVKK